MAAERFTSPTEADSGDAWAAEARAPVVAVISPASLRARMRSPELDALFAQLAYLDTQNETPTALESAAGAAAAQELIDDSWGELHDDADAAGRVGSSRRAAAKAASLHAASSQQAHSRARDVVTALLRFVLMIALAIGAAVAIQRWVVQPFKIPSESMSTTLETGDRILVNRLAYRTGDVEYADVVVFRRPDAAAALDGGDGLPEDLVKRVIGLPGDALEARDGTVYRNGVPVVEPYVGGQATTRLPLTIVPDGEIFVMGDNRGASRDSRFFGTIPLDHVVGKVVARYWPLDRLGRIR